MSLRNKVTDIALRIARVGRRGAPGGDDLRSQAPRQGSLVLFWAMGLDLEQPGLLTEIARFRESGDVVVVTDRLEFQAASELGCFIEALPSRQNRYLLTAIDWKRYAMRRTLRIRETWRPDFEITPGQTPEAYLESFEDATPALPAQESVVDYERSELPG